MLYPVKAITPDTHCQTLNDKGVDILTPIRERGFKVQTRVKYGVLGFDNVKRCWQGDSVGDSIMFAFYGTTLQVAIYQGPGPLGVMEVHVDGDKEPITKISSYFEGYYWAPTNGRQLIISLADDLKPGNHTVIFRIVDEPANPADPGHECQIIALLFSDKVTHA
jgi:hypothetical protein